MKSESEKYTGKSGTILRTIAVGIIVLLLFGFLIDMFGGFYVLRYSKSLSAGLAGFLLLAVFYLLGEAGAEWIHSKDDVSHPLYKRAFHLLLLLLFVGLILTVIGVAFRYFGLLQIQ